MKHPHNDNRTLLWWRVAIGAGALIFIAMALFSFAIYRRIVLAPLVSKLSQKEEQPILFSPALLDDMKTFWEIRVKGID